jgi:hypothetical protein
LLWRRAALFGILFFLKIFNIEFSIKKLEMLRLFY